MPTFLVDECLPRSVTRALLAAGYDALDVRDAGLRGASDASVHRRAVEEGRIVVTADLDFSNALRFPPGSHPGIVVLRVPGHWTPSQRAERVVSGVEEAGADRLAGAITIVEPARVRLFSP